MNVIAKYVYVAVVPVYCCWITHNFVIYIQKSGIGEKKKHLNILVLVSKPKHFVYLFSNHVWILNIKITSLFIQLSISLSHSVIMTFFFFFLYSFERKDSKEQKKRRRKEMTITRSN